MLVWPPPMALPEKARPNNIVQDARPPLTALWPHVVKAIRPCGGVERKPQEASGDRGEGVDFSQRC